MKKIIVVITDCIDIAYSEIRGVVFSNIGVAGIKDVIIEPVVKIAPFSIINGNFSLRLVADAYPEGTIFLIILNPLKERRERLIGKSKNKNFTFIGANTGVFGWFIDEYEISELYELNDPGFVAFGGKFVHAPALASILSGKDLESLGTKFDINKIRRIDMSNQIVHIDNFGLMKITNKLNNPKVGEEFEISIADKTFIAKYDIRMMSNDTGQWIIYPGSSFGLIEIGKVRENGAVLIGAQISQKVTIKKLLK